MAQRRLRIGIDVGGTFTDIVAIDTQSREIVTLKVSTTPREPERGVVTALAELLARYPQLPAIEFLGHSTTIATNALLGQLGLELPRAAMIVTEGFRDVIEIGRQNRSEIYDLFVERPRPLVAREDRLAVRERIDHRGSVLVELDEASLTRACDELRARGVAAVAICLLHAYANDAHERRVAQAIARALPGIPVVRSSEVDPEYREYERFSTTVVNAVLVPIVSRYLERLVVELRAMQVDAPLYVMRSDGGLSAVQQISRQPAAMIESGPASGAIAAAALTAGVITSSTEGCLSFDMGGTTAKAGAIVGGIVQIAAEFEAAGKTHSGRAVKGSGYPVRFPFVDLAEVSAGGGTIAWLDDAGSLRVGPLSAGADPGPACYGNAQRATVTDANVVLGRLHPTHLLGGTFPIDASRSRTAIAALAGPLGLSAEQTAAGIVTLIDNAMAKVLRIVTVERGLDPRTFTLVAFGGGGPLHACALAEELGIARIVIPRHPGIFSAYGLLVANVQATYVHPLLQTLGAVDFEVLERLFTQYEARGRAELLEQGVSEETIAFRREYDARYCGQSFELTIPHDPTLDALERRFHAAHRARYGYDVPEETIELVGARSIAYGRTASFDPGRQEAQDEIGSPTAAEGCKRRAWIENAFAGVPVFQRSELRRGIQLDGPAIVEQYDTTTYVAPPWALTVDGDVMTLQRKGAQR